MISQVGVVFPSYHSVGFIIPTSAACEVSGTKTENTLIVIPFITTETEELIPGRWQRWSYGVWKRSETRSCVNHDFMKNLVNCHSLSMELAAAYEISSSVSRLHHWLMKMVIYGMVCVEKLFKAIEMEAYCTERIWIDNRDDSRVAPSQWRYEVTPSLIGWAQTENQPCNEIIRNSWHPYGNRNAWRRAPALITISHMHTFMYELETFE